MLHLKSITHSSMKKYGSGGKKCQSDLRNVYLVNLEWLLDVERLLDVLTTSKNWSSHRRTLLSKIAAKWSNLYQIKFT